MPSGFREKKVLGGGAQSRGLTNLLFSNGISPFPNFCENVVVAEISYQMLEGLSFCDGERG